MKKIILFNIILLMAIGLYVKSNLAMNDQFDSVVNNSFQYALEEAVVVEDDEPAQPESQQILKKEQENPVQ